MTANTRQKRIVGAIMVTTTLVTFYVSVIRAKRIHDATRSKAVFIEQQVVANAERISCLLNTNVPQLHITTDLQTDFMADGYQHGFYIVDCENDVGKQLIHSTWDAETGRFISVTHTLNRSTRGHARASREVDPAGVAWHWLQRLDVAKLSPHWKVSAPPEMLDYNWTVVLQFDQYRVFVIFDRDTEDLVSLTIRSTDPVAHRP